MNLFSFALLRKKFTAANLLAGLLVVASLSSCDDEIRTSLDSSYVAYKYEYGSGTPRQVRVSPSGDDIGFNLGVGFFIGGANIPANPPKASIFRSSQAPIYAGSLGKHGPFNDAGANDAASLQLIQTKTSLSFAQNIRFGGYLQLIGKGGDNTHLYYIGLPLYATYWHTLQSKDQLFGGLGPYLSYGFGKAFGDNGDFKAFDAGATAIAGYKMNNSFSFGLSYELGLANIAKSTTGGLVAAKNRTISLNVGYPIRKLIKTK